MRRRSRLEVLDGDGAQRLRVLARLDQVQLVALRQDLVPVLLARRRLEGRTGRAAATDLKEMHRFK